MTQKFTTGVCILIVGIAAAVTKADEQLPAVTVTGKVTPTPPGDAVKRDWDQRSPEMNWPTPIFNGAAEIFAHNQIVINASCDKVWNHLIHAELWSQWCPYTGKVTIWGGSPVLERNSKFTWVSSDLPQDIPIFQIPEDRVDSVVIEYVPQSRLGWRSDGRAWSIHGVLVTSYHNWFIKPMGANECIVTFEEVATGVAARYARAAYPEFVHLSHAHWLQGLKRVSETHK
jgi:hypothetical protein